MILYNCNNKKEAISFQKAIVNHAIYYSGSKISYSTAKSRINSDKPFIMQLLKSNLKGEHSLVGVGSFYVFANENVLFYNPNGYYRSFEYSWPKYTVNGDLLTWEATIY